jgi:hypothetical protein
VQWLTTLLGKLVNPFAWLPPGRRRRAAYWAVHILVVLLIVAGLAWLNFQGNFPRVLRTRALGLERVWLPLLFLLGYALFWLIRWLYWLLGPDGVAGEFDDIESAWRQARGRLEEAGIELREVPVFLVLGRPAGSLEQFFAASRMPFEVRHAPREGEAPLHVYANREAAFVTCEGASLLPLQTERLLESAAAAEPAPAQLDEFLAAGEGVSEALPEPAPAETGAQPDLYPAPAATAPAAAPGRRGAVLLLGEPEPAAGEEQRPAGPGRPGLVKDLEKVDLAARRLRHVCRLLDRDRQPYCPANGILVLVPAAATASPEDAAETAAVARQDLEVARGALQLDCPRFLVLCDAERLPGFAEVVRHFPPGAGGPSWVLGQHFPLAADVPASEVPALIESGMAWVADTLLPLVIGKLWRREGEEGVPDRAAAVEANMELYEFLHACRQRLVLLGRLAARATQQEGAPPLLAGCYLAGTGADAAREQGFLAGVLRRAIEHQNQVRWTADALADDAAYHRYAFVGYALLAAFVVAVALILLAWW